MRSWPRIRSAVHQDVVHVVGVSVRTADASWVRIPLFDALVQRYEFLVVRGQN